MAVNGYDRGEPNWDHRDQAVLDVLEANDADKVDLSDLQTIYRQATDVRNRETMRDRIRFLVENGPFEKLGLQRWEYTG